MVRQGIKITYQMKYLRKFNEELKPQTYRSAARKLTKLGHTDRANTLTNWANEMENKEEMVKWKDQLQDYANFGTFNINIRNIETDEKMTGEFALAIHFDELAFSDEPESGICFFVGLVPTSEELIQKCNEFMSDPEFGNGFYWGMIFNLEYNITDQIKFKKWNLWDYDDNLSGKVAFADRASANKFKNLLIKIVSDSQLNYPSGYTDVAYLYQKLEAVILAEQSFSSEYGFQLEDTADYIKTISPNELSRPI